MNSHRGRIALCAISLIVLGVASITTAQVRTIRAVDEGDLVILHGNTHPLARPEFDRGPVAATLPMRQMILALHNSPEQEAALQRLMAEQQDPSSPNYHRWLTPAEYGARFGPSLEDIAAVTSWLESHGFRIDQVSKGRRQIQFSGTSRLVEGAFHTPIHKFVVAGEQHIANTTDPQIPAALASVVSGVVALHDFRAKAQHQVLGTFNRSKETGRYSLVKPDITFPGGGCSVDGNCYGVGPTDFATIYNVQPLWDDGIDGTGQTIAIVQRSNINVSDVNTFRSLFGLPSNPPEVVVTNSDPGLTDDETEAVLDVEWSGAVAKNATIKMVTSSSGTSDGVILSAQYIVDNNLAPVVSMSYGLCELGQGTAGNADINALWQQAAAQGQTVFISTGDSGSAGCDNPDGTTPASFGLQVNGLASTSYNIAVGGTDFHAFADPSLYWSPTNDASEASALSYIPETTWNATCANPLISEPTFGFPKNPVANCNNSQLISGEFYKPVGGSGGKSNCTVSDQTNTSSCSHGYLKPSWQAGPGVPNDGVRDVPDVALFASSGFFGSSYVICQADQTGGSCDLTNNFLGIGGTSASAPAMAGIMALVNQKVGMPQGNANYVFYKMAAAESAASCNSSKGSGSSCVFNDVTSGTIAMPCIAGTLNCAGTGTFGVGVLTGYSTGVGYDLATGLGSVNAANLANSWPEDSIQFSAPAFSVSETGTKATIGVSRLGSSLEPISATWTVTGGTAVFGTDYSVQTGTVTIPSGAMSGSFVLPVLHDNNTSSRVAILALSAVTGPGGSTLGAQSETALTIANIDKGGALQFAMNSGSVNAGGIATLHVSRIGGTASSVTVDYHTQAGTAAAGTDYTTTIGTLTFAASQTTLPITIQTTAHAPIVEPDVTFSVVLTNAGGGGTLGAIANQTATVKILEGAAAVKFGAASYTASELVPSKVVTVMRTGNLTTPVSVNILCTSSNATGANYSCPPTASILAGKTSGTFTVTILHDHVHTGNLTVNLALSGATGAYVGTPGTVPLTIMDADPAAVVQFATATVSANESAGIVSLTAKRTGGAPGGQVSYQTVAGTATSPADYVTQSGTLTFNGTEMTKTITITLNNDPTPTADRTFSVTLSNPAAGAALGKITTAVVKIVEGDTGLQFSAPASTVGELGHQATVTVKRVGNLAPAVSVSVNCTSSNATSPANYTCPSSPVTILAGKPTATFPVIISHDGVHTGNLTVNMALTGPSGAYLASPNAAALTITDADPAALLSLSATSYTVNETAGNASISVKRTGVLTGQVTVQYQTSPGTALAGTNYTTTSGTLTFHGTGDNLQAFNVPIINGGEAKLTFNVGLSSPTGTNAALGLASAAVSITDTDTAGVVQFKYGTIAVSQTDGTVAIVVTRSLATGTASVQYATSNGTAASGSDYSGGTGTVTFAAGVTTQTISIPITDHSPTTGPPKFFTVTLSAPSPGADLGAQDTATIWIDEEQTD